MYLLLGSLLALSVVGNVVLVWYTRKLIENMNYGIANIDEMQKLFDEYVTLLEPLATMENYYGDPAITSAVANTKLVIDACRVYKKTMIENYDEENQENDQVSQEGTEKNARQERATISAVGPNLS